MTSEDMIDRRAHFAGVLKTRLDAGMDIRAAYLDSVEEVYGLAERLKCEAATSEGPRRT